MAYKEYLTQRIEIIFNKMSIEYEAKKMFGGISFLVDNKMCLAINNDDLLARVGEEAERKFQDEDGVRPIDFTKKRMKGFLYVNKTAIDRKDDLELWVKRCMDFNPNAISN